MASDKITQKILEDAESNAKSLIDQANADAEAETKRIETETTERLKKLEEELFEDQKKEFERAQLNANLEERKNFLENKRVVLDKAFRRAREKLQELPRELWEELILKIVLAGTTTDTAYIKVPEEDFEKYTLPYEGYQPFIIRLNEFLEREGHYKPLRLDKNPAHFSGGLMLIGKYSDVNASFEVLIENQRESLEAKVADILFGEDDERD